MQDSAAATDTDHVAGEEASSVLDSICELYHSGKAKYTDGQRYEKLRYDMLISCLDGALPKQNAAVVSRCLSITTTLVLLVINIMISNLLRKPSGVMSVDTIQTQSNCMFAR